MEHHHLDQCIMILTEESNNIFQVMLALNNHSAIVVIIGCTVIVNGTVQNDDESDRTRHFVNRLGHLFSEENQIRHHGWQRRIWLAGPGAKIS